MCQEMLEIVQQESVGATEQIEELKTAIDSGLEDTDRDDSEDDDALVAYELKNKFSDFTFQGSGVQV